MPALQGKGQRFLGQIYRNELGYELQKLGYHLDCKDNGLFEIKGYTQKQLDTFSKRSLEIKEAVGENASSQEKEYAALRTRITKDKESNRDDLHKYWLEEVKSKNVVHPQPDKSLIASMAELEKNRKIRLDRHINNAIAHCSERNVNFTRKGLEQFILSEVGRSPWKELKGALDCKEKSLLKAKQGEKTTTKALFRELNTIRFVQESKNSVVPIADRQSVESQLEDKTLTEGQRSAIITAATTSDRFVAWQGKAGAGKTYALNEFKEIAQQKGYTVRGYAPSAEAAKTLENELGIESNTVARLLYSKKEKDPKESLKSSENEQIWIVDEAGLLNAKDGHNLVKRATEEKARVILVGDTRQLSGVEAGNPFKSLQKAGMTTAYLNQSFRQKSTDLKEAVNLISEGKIKSGIEILQKNDRIYEYSSPEEKIEDIARDYLALSPEERKKTLILAGRKDEKEAILKAVRSGLKKEGSLGREAEVFQLKASDLTNAQLRYAHNFKEGHVIRILRDYKRLGLEKGEFLTVLGRDKKERDKILIRNKLGKTHKLDPSQFRRKAVFEKGIIEIAEGDRLRWLRNDPQKKRRNGQEFTVTKIAGDKAFIKYDTGRTESLDLNSPQHFDYALVSTTYSSQGKTADRVLVGSSVDRTLNRESLYVATSRAKHDLIIYTNETKDNQTTFLEKSLESGAKKNPQEIIESVDNQHELAKAHLKTFFAAQRAESSKNKPNFQSEDRPNEVKTEKQQNREQKPEQKSDNSQINTNSLTNNNSIGRSM